MIFDTDEIEASASHLNQKVITLYKSCIVFIFDVVYFDPMFKEPNRKSASINSFRDFADHRGLTKEILMEALRVCKKRVVIKERQGSNEFEKLGIEKYYGGKAKVNEYTCVERRNSCSTNIVNEITNLANIVAKLEKAVNSKLLGI